MTSCNFSLFSECQWVPAGIYQQRPSDQLKTDYWIASWYQCLLKSWNLFSKSSSSLVTQSGYFSCCTVPVGLDERTGQCTAFFRTQLWLNERHNVFVQLVHLFFYYLNMKFFTKIKASRAEIEPMACRVLDTPGLNKPAWQVSWTAVRQPMQKSSRTIMQRNSLQSSWTTTLVRIQLLTWSFLECGLLPN